MWSPIKHPCSVAGIICVAGALAASTEYIYSIHDWFSAYHRATHSYHIFASRVYSCCSVFVFFNCMHAFIWTRIRLRQESELLSRSSSQHWSQSQSDLQSYASTTSIANDNDAAFVQSSDSLSSTETLKWLGSMSDISSSSHATNTSHISASGSFYHSLSQKIIGVEIQWKKQTHARNEPCSSFFPVRFRNVYLTFNHIIIYTEGNWAVIRHFSNDHKIYRMCHSIYGTMHLFICFIRWANTVAEHACVLYFVSVNGMAHFVDFMCIRQMFDPKYQVLRLVYYTALFSMYNHHHPPLLTLILRSFTNFNIPIYSCFWGVSSRWETMIIPHCIFKTCTK